MGGCPAGFGYFVSGESRLDRFVCELVTRNADADAECAMADAGRYLWGAVVSVTRHNLNATLCESKNDKRVVRGSGESRESPEGPTDGPGPTRPRTPTRYVARN